MSKSFYVSNIYTYNLSTLNISKSPNNDEMLSTINIINLPEETGEGDNSIDGKEDAETFNTRTKCY